MDENPFTAPLRRPAVGVLLKCCNIYIRAHLATDAYVGQCPRCSTPVRIALSPEGTTLRLAKAS